MSKSKADEVAEKTARINARQQAKAKTPATSSAVTDEPTEQDRAAALAPRRPSVAPVNARPVRSTVDLSPARHAALKGWCNEAAPEIGRSRVTTQDVLRAMVVRLLTDATFASTIRQDLLDDKQ